MERRIIKAGGTDLCSEGNRQDMNKPNVLIPNDLYLVGDPEPIEIVPKLLFDDRVVEIAGVDVWAWVALADG